MKESLLRRANPVGLGGLVAALAFAAVACDKGPKPDDRAASSATATPSASGNASAAPSASAGPAEPPLECEEQECTVTAISDRIASELEKRPDHQKLRLVFGAATTDADLKTVAKVPWVTDLRINSEKVTDALALLPLKSLKSLDISATKIKSLSALATMTGLVTFDAHGVEELEDVSALGSHPGLESINLTGSSVTDIRAAYNWTSLKHLELEKSKIEDLRPLKGCTKLEYLDIDATRVKDLAPLEKLVALKKLSFSKTPVTTTAPLKDLVELETLDLSESKVRDLSGLKAMKKLTSLKMAGAKQVSDLKPLLEVRALLDLDASGTLVNDLTPLVGMRKLKLLDLTGTPNHDVLRLSQTTDLEELRIAGTWVSDLLPLKGLKKLKKIVVGKNVPKKRIDELTKASPNVTVEVAEK